MIEETFFTGQAIDVSDTVTSNEFGFESGIRSVRFKLENEEIVIIDQAINLDNPSDNVPIGIGDEFLLVQSQFEGESSYAIQDVYRLDGMLILFVAFVLLVGFVAGKKGLLSLLGLAASLLIIIKWVIPQILAGGNPVVISFVGSVFIAIITFYLSHGFKKRTTLALLSTLFTLVLGFLLSVMAVRGLSLFGTGSEDAIALTFGNLSSINLQGLLLGAIVIGTLGVLDDVTITQIATVHQIHEADRSLGYRQLYQRGLKVGKDHIASIINTLVLAYAGASFPVLIALVAWPRPLWVNLNSEFLAEEIVRTLVGSMTLIVAIPMATLLAAYYYSGKKAKPEHLPSLSQPQRGRIF